MLRIPRHWHASKRHRAHRRYLLGRYLPVYPIFSGCPHVGGLESSSVGRVPASCRTSLLSRDRFLWMSGAGLSWLARQSLGKTKMDTKQFHTLGDQFQKELAAILRSAPSFDLLSLDIPNNRERHDAELARRHRNGVAVRTAPYITTVSSLLKRKRTWNEPELGETSRQVQANRNSTPSEEKPSSQVQLFAKTLSAEVASLQTDNSRLKNLLQDSERICEELSARFIEAQTRVDDLKNSQRELEERLTKAEIKLKERQKNAVKQD
ncbi:hypothetical protein FB451DRAFT_1559458, partial [Mycena latifolia]